MLALLRRPVTRFILTGTLLPPVAQAQDLSAPEAMLQYSRLPSVSEVDTPPPAVAQGPPANLRAGAFQRLVEQMWQVSPTFRKQCVRLAAASGLTITVQAESLRRRSDVRALTMMRRDKASLVRADINLLVVGDAVELIAHEIEHIIEQLDGIDERPDACGRHGSSGAVETCRAVDVGRRVAAEVREAHQVRLMSVRQRETLRGPAEPPGAHVSGNGRFVAFVSPARLLHDAPRGRNLYVLDLEGGELRLESLHASRADRHGGFTSPRLSADGNLVVFSATRMDEANVLALDVLTLHRPSGAVRALNVETATGSPGRHNRAPAVSADGSTVVFESTPIPRTPGDRPVTDIYLVRLHSGDVEHVSVSAEAGARQSGYVAPGRTPAVSADGRVVAFASTADLTCGPAAECDRQRSGGRRHSAIYARDTHVGTTVHISRSLRGGEPDGPSSWPAISADGRFIAFTSDASNLVARDGNGVSDVFVHDRLTGITELVSRRPDGRAGNGPSRFPAISGDGAIVAFQSLASDLICAKRCGPPDRDINLLWDVFLFDRWSGAMVRASADERGEWMAPSSAPSLDHAGRVVVFSSREPIDEHDTDNDDDLYVWMRPVRDHGTSGASP
jgi:Tol biopolymer transport system component